MARSLRVDQQLTVDQLAARMSLPRSTIYYWVRDLPLSGGTCVEGHKGERVVGGDAAGALNRGRSGQARKPEGGNRLRGERSPRTVTRARSEAAYEEGLGTFEELSAQPTFRDFVCIYLVLGEQRDRARVALTNSDPEVMRLVSRWIRRLTDRAPFLSLQYWPGQSLKELRLFWSEATGAEPGAIHVRRPSAESGLQPALASPHGQFTVTVNDTLLRARLQGWMHRAREGWR